MKVVINACYGGFGVSPLANEEIKKSGIHGDFRSASMRANKSFVEIIERLGPLASGECSDLRVVEIPDGVDFVIEEHDGFEHIAECHRTWHATGKVGV